MRVSQTFDCALRALRFIVANLKSPLACSPPSILGQKAIISPLEILYLGQLSRKASIYEPGFVLQHTTRKIGQLTASRHVIRYFTHPR